MTAVSQFDVFSTSTLPSSSPSLSVGKRERNRQTVPRLCVRGQDDCFLQIKTEGL